MHPMRTSKQRDAILRELQGRTDHPTAEEVYLALKSEWPALSLGTVYRNLAQLCQAGLAQRLPGQNAEQHFDATAAPHGHVVCARCGRMFDLDLPPGLLTDLQKQAAPGFAGKLLAPNLQFSGICAGCAAEEQRTEQS